LEKLSGQQIQWAHTDAIKLVKAEARIAELEKLIAQYEAIPVMEEELAAKSERIARLEKAIRFALENRPSLGSEAWSRGVLKSALHPDTEGDGK
jgi:uncharacterized coiled-coil protein SlyX